MVAGIPDSGTGHAIGYANEAGIPYRRPFVKYTPTWPRSFMPQDQRVRDLVARMKLIPIRELIEGKRLLFCEDSIVRGTQLKDTIQRLYDYGAKEVHMRPACPPLVYGCKFLNFSRSKSELDLAGRKAIQEIEGTADRDLDEYADPDSDKYAAMVEAHPAAAGPDLAALPAAGRPGGGDRPAQGEALHVLLGRGRVARALEQAVRRGCRRRPRAKGQGRATFRGRADRQNLRLRTCPYKELRRPRNP